ncbi:MAG: NAD(P)-dependent oxidoreductase [Endomicrobium sp.]|jgi:nucleoside-diphosphate-sugar epimerase|nr:NAD(P)-dependent oxidoreductase [Endomicrobium sp.]
MKVLLTGATGFLGSSLLNALVKSNYDIIILKRSFSDICRIKALSDYIISYDIDKTELERIFNNHKNIDAVIHTATCYGRKNESAAQILYSNSHFPLELLELSAKYKVKSFINSATTLPHTKKGQMHHYTLSKRQFAQWGAYFCDRINFINMKIAYMYGPYDDKNKFIPSLIESCIKNCAEFNLTAGGQKRDFVYIDDAVSAYLAVLNTETKNCCEYEIGSGTSISIKEAALKIKEITKSNIKLNFGAVPYREEENTQMLLDVNKSSSLNWKAKYNFEDGIKKLISEEYQK